MHADNFFGRAFVDFSDPCMRIGAAQKNNMQKIRHIEIIDKATLSAQQAIVFQPCMSGFSGVLH
jgi:hypothetical protein